MKTPSRAYVYLLLAAMAAGVFVLKSRLDQAIPALSPTARNSLNVMRDRRMARWRERLATMRHEAESRQPEVRHGDIADPHQTEPGFSAPSNWFSRRRERYKDLLSGWSCDVLVVPTQIDYVGFDYPSRMLMAGQLAGALAKPGRCVVDPFLADLALGEGMRTHSVEDVRALATAVHARQVLWTRAGYDEGPGGRRMHLGLAVQDQNSSDAALAWHDLGDLPLDPKTPSFEVFRQHMPELAAAAGLELDKPVGPAPAGHIPAVLPATPAAVIASAERQPLALGARFLLLAMLAPGMESYRSGDRLLCKSWLALAAADPADTAVRHMKARILFHLNQRPAALEQLGTQEDAGTAGLRAMLNGNLPPARRALADARDPWEALFLAIELHDLEERYQRHNDTGDRAAKKAAGAEWATLVAARLADTNAWKQIEPVEIKKLLDKLLPIPGASLNDFVRGQVVIGQLDDDERYQLLAARHAHELLERHGRDLCCASFDLQPKRLDLLDLLDSRGDQTLVSQAYFLGETQGRPEQGLSLLDHYADELAGQPDAELVRAESLWKQIAQGVREGQDERITKMHRAARTAAYYAQGQSSVSANALWYMAQPPTDPLLNLMGAYGFDYPMRQIWSAPPTSTAEQLEFSSDNAAPLKLMLDFTPAADRAQRLAGYDGRFEGSPAATRLRYARDVDPAAIRAAIARDADNWELYEALGNVLIRQGAYGEASRAILAFPDFKGGGAGSAVLQSNRAYSFGQELFTKGAYDAARPLLRIAADLDTGSGGSENAAVNLALLDGRYREAALRSLGTARHYQDMWAYGQYLSLLFAGGESSAAWAGFEQLTSRYNSHDLWWAAQVGHRRDNLTADQLAKWLSDRAAASRREHGDHGLVDYALSEFITDRAPPPDNLPEMISRLAGADTAKFEEHGSYGPADKRGSGYYSATQPSQMDVRVGPSALPVPHAQAPRRAGAVAPAISALFAEAYVAFRRERYDQAVGLFQRIASYYSIESAEDETGNFSYVLPYFAFASAKSGDSAGLEKFLAALPEEARNQDVLLALASFQALRGEHDAALHSLDAAERTSTNFDRPVTPSYAYVETCVRLYEATGEARYRSRALNWARAYRKRAPFKAWAHAIVGRYGEGDAERIPALGMALYLDPQSQWANEAPAEQKDHARAWLNSHRPFKLEAGPEDQHI